MAPRKRPETVFLVTGNDHRGIRKPYAVCAQEHHAAFKTRFALSCNPQTEAEYKEIKWDEIPRGWKSKVIYK